MASVNWLSRYVICESPKRSKIADNTLTGSRRRTDIQKGFLSSHKVVTQSSFNGYSSRRCCRNDWQSSAQPMKSQWSCSVVQSHQFHQWMFEVNDDSPHPCRHVSIYASVFDIWRLTNFWTLHFLGETQNNKMLENLSIFHLKSPWNQILQLLFLWYNAMFIIHDLSVHVIIFW